MTARELYDGGAWRSAWQGSACAEVTLSQARAWRAMIAARQVGRAIISADSGFTRTRALGAWRGGRERSYTFAIVADDAAALAPILDAATRAAYAAGCEAVQIAVRDGASYRVHEAREAVAS